MTKGRQKVISWSAIGLVLASAVALMLFLLPSDKELIQRFIVDQDFENARRYLEAYKEENVDSDPKLVQELELKIAIAEATTSGQSLTENQSKELLAALLDPATNAPLRDLLLKKLSLAKGLNKPEAFDLSALQKLSPSDLEDLREAMRVHLLAQNDALMAAEWYEALLFEPVEDADVKHLIQLRLAAGQQEKALEALKTYRNQTEWLPQKSELLLGLGLPDKALEAGVEYYRNIEDYSSVELEPADLLRMAGYMNDYSEVLSALKPYLEANPQDVETTRAVIDIYIQTGRIERAKRLLNEMVRQSGDPDAKRLLAMLSEWSGEAAEAFDFYLPLAAEGNSFAIDRLLALNPGIMRSRDLLNALGGLPTDALSFEQKRGLLNLQVELGEYAEAAQLAERLLSESDSPYELHVLMGQLYRNQFKLNEAAQSYTDALDLRPDDVQSLRARGQIYSLMRRRLEAREDYSRAYALAVAQEDLARVLSISQMIGDWENYYESLMRGVLGEALTEGGQYLNLATFLIRNNRDEEAERALLAGIKNFPNFEALHRQLLFFYADRERDDEALACFSRSEALRKDPKLYSFRLYLLTRTNQIDKAIAYLDQLPPEQWQNNVEMLASAGYLYQQIGRRREAEALFGKAYRMDPSNTESALRWVSILTERGKISEARAILDPLMKNPTQEVLRRSAELFAAGEQYELAEQQVLEMLRRPFVLEPRDWGLLGDIRLSQGDRKGSRQAYRLAANALISKNKVDAAAAN